jgi:hypothetical protein
MKKILPAVCLLALSLTAFSQDYYPLVQDNKSWDVLDVAFLPPFDTSSFSTSTFMFSGDTLINDVTYNKMYMSYDWMVNGPQLWGMMREDAGKRVWMIRPSEETESLMYDFSIGTGDSVEIGTEVAVYLFVDSIASISVNGTLRSKYWLSCKDMPSYHETWIEGIGSSKGIIWSGSTEVVGGWSWLLCMSQDDELVYMNPAFNACHLTTGIAHNATAEFRLSPNPANGVLYLENTGKVVIKALSLMDLTGRTIRQYKPEQGRLDVTGLLPGIYFLKISFADGNMVRKVLIEDR